MKPWLLAMFSTAVCVTAPAFASPATPLVVSGTATINQPGNVLTVTNSNGAIINWDKFNISSSEITRFVQPSASSSV
ncbi:MAG: hemagglutinin, partial [Proteobacteria bacterium]|nr:hemagglutinin [Pseudomonadota bacterium]